MDLCRNRAKACSNTNVYGIDFRRADFFKGCIDQGLVNFYSVSGSPDLGRLLENTVYLSLRRSQKEIWYFKEKNECDFICRQEKNKYSAIQVTWQVGLQNEKREIEGLLEAMDQLNLTEGTIITFNQEDRLVKDGKTVKLIPAWKWMSG